MQAFDSCLWFLFFSESLHLKILHTLRQFIRDLLQLSGAVIHLFKGIQNFLCLRIGLLGAVDIVPGNLRQLFHSLHDFSTGLGQSAGTLSDLQNTLHGILDLF